MIEFIIPGECVAQGRPRGSKQGKRIIMRDPKESRDYKKYVGLIARQHAPKKPLEEALWVELKIYRQIPKRTSKKDRALIFEGLKRPVTKPDTDNYTKSVLDACNGIIYQDDSQIAELYASKYYSDDPRVEITIKEIDLLEVGG